MATKQKMKNEILSSIKEQVKIKLDGSVIFDPQNKKLDFSNLEITCETTSDGPSEYHKMKLDFYKNFLNILTSLNK